MHAWRESEAGDGRGERRQPDPVGDDWPSDGPRIWRNIGAGSSEFSGTSRCVRHPLVTLTASAFHRLNAFTGPPDQERQDRQWQYPMASGEPVTSSSTAPQKQLPLWFMISPAMFLGMNEVAYSIRFPTLRRMHSSFPDMPDMIYGVIGLKPCVYLLPLFPRWRHAPWVLLPAARPVPARAGIPFPRRRRATRIFTAVPMPCCSNMTPITTARSRATS